MDPVSIFYSYFSKSDSFRALQYDWWILTDRGSSKFTSPYSNILFHEKKWRVYYYCNMRWVIPDHFEITLILPKVQIIATRIILTLEKCMCLYSHRQYVFLPTRFFLVFSFLLLWTMHQPTRIKRKTAANCGGLRPVRTCPSSVITKAYEQELVKLWPNCLLAALACECSILSSSLCIMHV